MSVEQDASRLPADWAEALVKHGLNKDELDSLVDDLYAGDSDDATLPDRADLFRAFHLTPLDEVRFVILGQDPYPTKGDAHGLAFSFKGERPFPRSLTSIFQNLASDPEILMADPCNGDLTPWAENGVLLLNTALTFKGRSRVQLRRWQWFTDLVLEVVDDKRKPVAFLAWGAPAIKKVETIGIANRHVLIPTAHPVVWGKSKVRTFKECHPFTEASNFLGSDPKDWTLPTATD